MLKGGGEVKGTLFINRNVGVEGTGAVPQLWLKMHHYQGGDRGRRTVTSFFHLLDL